MKGTCSKCKKEKAVGKYKGGVFCDGCLPRVVGSPSGQDIGIGVRIRRTMHGDALKGLKGDRNRRSKRKMRTNLGMTREFRR